MALALRRTSGSIVSIGVSKIWLNFEPFKDVKLLNKFDIEIDYTYIGPDENVASRGYDYYGSTSGTDSIAFGGFLR